MATWLLILTQVYAISLAQFSNLFDLLYLGSVILVLYYYLLARLVDPGYLPVEDNLQVYEHMVRKTDVLKQHGLCLSCE